MKLRKQNNSGSVSIVIPKNILKDLNWNCGEEILLKISGDNLVIKNLDKMEEPKVGTGDNMVKATELWCDITNRLIRKYKTMTEENPDEAMLDLYALKKLLLATGYLEA